MTQEEISATAKGMLTGGRFLVLATVDQQEMAQMWWMGSVAIEDPFTAYLVAGARARGMGRVQGRPFA